MFQLKNYPPATFGFVCTCAGMLAVLLISAWHAFQRRHHARYRGESLAWLVGMSAVSVLTILISFRLPKVPIYLFGAFFVAIWLIAAMGCVLSWWRTLSQKDRERDVSRTRLPNCPDFVGVFIVLFAAKNLFFTSLPVLLFFTRESINRVVCNTNMKFIHSALQEFVSTHESLPKSGDAEPAVSWRVAILPFLGEQPLFQQYDFQSEWDSVFNEPSAKTDLWYWRCPTATAKKDSDLLQDHRGRYFSHYAMPTGPQTVGSSVKPAQMSDGLSNTILLVEASGLKIVWTEPRDSDTTALPAGVNLPGRQYGESPGWISSNHPLGAYVMMADGSIRYLLENTDPHVLRSLVKISDGEGNLDH